MFNTETSRELFILKLHPVADKRNHTFKIGIFRQLGYLVEALSQILLAYQVLDLQDEHP